jgi:hypothetical protein
MTPEDERKVRAKALGLVLPHFPDAKIIAIRDTPVQETAGEQQEAPKADTPAPKLPEFLRRAKRSASSKS